MGRVVDLQQRQVEALALQIVPELREYGYLMVGTDKVDDVDRWRKAARRAGRLLGWHVRTGVLPDGARVWAASNDFPVTDDDRREAARRLEEVLLAIPPPGAAASEKPGRLTPVDEGAPTVPCPGQTRVWYRSTPTKASGPRHLPATSK